ncbi:MAG: hypothetical protein WCQ54_12265 [Clostridiaceae bacterium]
MKNKLGIFILGLFIISIILFIFIECDNRDGKGVETVYPTAVRWNDTVYYFTPKSTIVAEKDIGEQINTIKKNVKKLPKKTVKPTVI